MKAGSEHAEGTELVWLQPEFNRVAGAPTREIPLNRHKTEVAVPDGVSRCERMHARASGGDKIRILHACGRGRSRHGVRPTLARN